MIRYDDYIDPEADPNAPGTYVPPVQMANPLPPPVRPGWTQDAVNEARNPFTGQIMTTPPAGGPPSRPGMSEADGRAYDAAHGLLGGYMGPNGWVSGEPRSSGGGGGGGGGSAMGMPQSPAFQWPNFQSAGAFTPRDSTFDYEKFSHPDYTPSSWDDVTKQPGYEDSEKRLRQQIEAGAAYKGMVRSGMAIGDLYSGLDSFRGQKFNEFDNRRFRDYSANRDNKFGAWQGNLGAEATKFGLELGADRDIYDRFATDVDRGNNFRFNTASKDFDSILSKWLKQVDSLTSIATAGNT